MSWGEIHADHGPDSLVAEAHRALDKAGIAPGTLAERALEAARQIILLDPKERTVTGRATHNLTPHPRHMPADQALLDRIDHEIQHLDDALKETE